MNVFLAMVRAAWDLLLDSSVYILIGLVVGGLLKAFLSPALVAKHLGQGRYSSVFKAALFGIPLPLCSCGVLPAAAAIKKQGANNGATTAFLIATPESGVDSMVVSYALLDPIMTVARPVAAFCTAVIAGLMENLRNPPQSPTMLFAQSSPVDTCCSDDTCSPAVQAGPPSFWEKIGTGVRFAFTDLWPELAGWFFIGILLGGIITALVPDDFFARYLGGGLTSMLAMLAVGIPLYICATASTPIAAALILKGVSPGTALVFLLAGPATNVTSLAVLTSILGKRATGLYLVNIAVVSVCCGLLLDRLYAWAGISPIAIIGKAGEVMPGWMQYISVSILLILSAKPISNNIRLFFAKQASHKNKPGLATGCGCGKHCANGPVDLPDKPNRQSTLS